MTNELTNGKVSQRDLYTAIADLRNEQREGFQTVTHDIRDLGERVRGVELSAARHESGIEQCAELAETVRGIEVAQLTEQAHDDERQLMLREQQRLATEQGASRRWLVGLFIMTATSLAIAVIGAWHTFTPAP